MTPDTRTLLVVADGTRVRLFEEPRRGGRLVEHADWVGALKPHPSMRPPVGAVHDRMGHALHGMADETPGGKSERDFLRRLAQRLEVVMRAERFDALAIFAPPRALGVLREVLAPGLRTKLSHDAPAERLDETPEALRRHLRALRLDDA